MAPCIVANNGGNVGAFVSSKCHCSEWQWRHSQATLFDQQTVLIKVKNRMAPSLKDHSKMSTTFFCCSGSGIFNHHIITSNIASTSSNLLEYSCTCQNYVVFPIFNKTLSIQNEIEVVIAILMVFELSAINLCKKYVQKNSNYFIPSAFHFARSRLGKSITA